MMFMAGFACGALTMLAAVVAFGWWCLRAQRYPVEYYGPVEDPPRPALPREWWEDTPGA